MQPLSDVEWAFALALQQERQLAGTEAGNLHENNISISNHKC